MQYVIKIWR